MIRVLLYASASDADEFIHGLPVLRTDVVLAAVPPRETTPELAAAEVLLGSTADLPTAIATQAPSVRWIHLFNVGLNRFPETHALPPRLLLSNSRGVSAGAMADHALLLMLAWSRDFVHWIGQQQRREWDRSKYGQMTTLEGRTVGVLGLGMIGRQVARRARAVGMRVVATRRRPPQGPPELADPDADALVPLDAMLERADFVVVTAPLTKDTAGLLDARALRRMKSTAYLINLSRGAIVVESALVAALEAGRLAGAGLDVFETEPLPEHSPLWSMSNVIITPHVSAGSGTVMRETADLWVANLERYLAGAPLLTPVDLALGY